jgi:PEP-CTERM motif
MRNAVTSVSLLTLSLLLPHGSADAAFTPGDYFDAASNQVKEFTPSGGLVASYTLPLPSDSQIRGIAFGPDGNLYAVINLNNNGYEVLEYNGKSVVNTYIDPNNVGSDTSLGQIAFDSSGHFYVGDSNGLSQFTIGSTFGNPIFHNVQIGSIFGVTSLPNGDLLLASQSELVEITTSGSLVRTISNNEFVDLIGVAYNASSNVIYASMLGSTNNFSQLMELNPATGAVIAQTSYPGIGNLAMTPDGRLLGGSSTLVPGIFRPNLALVGQLTGGAASFVTTMPIPASVPEPASLILSGSGLLAVAVVALRRRGAVAGGRRSRGRI